MNVKKTLESRIRGWFPQEPKLSGKYVQKPPIEVKAKMDNEPKRMIVGFLSVIGSISFAFSIYNYIVDPSRWLLAWAAGVFFLVVGAVSITLAIVIQKMKTSKKTTYA